MYTIVFVSIQDQILTTHFISTEVTFLKYLLNPIPPVLKSQWNSRFDYCYYVICKGIKLLHFNQTEIPQYLVPSYVLNLRFSCVCVFILFSRFYISPTSLWNRNLWTFLYTTSKLALLLNTSNLPLCQIGMYECHNVQLVLTKQKLCHLHSAEKYRTFDKTLLQLWIHIHAIILDV
jgi:hypothetical protein